MSINKILITGASGQLGTVLTQELQNKYGISNVIASDLRMNSNYVGEFEILDATNFEILKEIVIKHKK